MRKCIICLENKSEEDFNIEHIFPDALGGALTINTVCVKCNSILGRLIDQPFLSHGMVAFYRNRFNLARNEKRRRGNIPNPFNAAIAGSDGNKYIVKFKDGQPYCEVIENLKIEEDPETGLHIAKVVIPSNKIDELDSIFKKLAKRQGFDIIKYESASQNFLQNAPLTATIDADNNTFILGCLKIAYEALIYFFPEYLLDPTSSLIRDSIRSGEIHDELKALLSKHHTHLMNKYVAIFQKIQGLRIEDHAFLIENVENIGLVCCVRVFNWIYPVLISKTNVLLPKDHCIFVYNNALVREFKSNMQHFYSNVNLTLDLVALNQTDRSFIISNGESAFRKKDQTLPIYDKDGILKYSDPYEFCIGFMKMASPYFKWNDTSFEINVSKQSLFVQTENGIKVNILSFKTDRKIILQSLY